MFLALVILPLLTLTSCGPRKPPVQPSDNAAIPQPVTLLGDPDYIVVFVNEEGSLFLGEEAVTEEQLVEEARRRLLENPDIKAVLYVSSSQIQGIHLTILFSEAGYKNVVVYYPTASPPR
jgi:hypothetical protein